MSVRAGLTPFVGRERELELLLDGFERVKVGKGRPFPFVLKQELANRGSYMNSRKAVANEDATFLEGGAFLIVECCLIIQCWNPWSQPSDIPRGRGDQEIREKVKKGLRLMGVDETSTLPYILELLSAKTAGLSNLKSPEAKKDRHYWGMQKNCF